LGAVGSEFDGSGEPLAVVADLDNKSRHVRTRFSDAHTVWRTWGQGEPVVLLHGGFGSWTHWLCNVECLAGRHSVFAPDIPGFGDSDFIGETADARTIAAHLWAGLDDILGPAQPVALVGFSFGGAIAGTMAGIRPAQTRQLVLVGSGGLRAPRGDVEPMVRWRGARNPAEALAAHRRNLEILMFRDPSRVDALSVAIQVDNTRRARTRSRPISRGTDLAAGLTGSGVPVSGIWGEFDATSAGYLQERAEILRSIDPHSRLIVIEGAGHWVQYEAADRFNEALIGLLGDSPKDVTGSEAGASPRGDL
jgi:pimeloyl-ACP methyl ester carboxylesterase